MLTNLPLWSPFSVQKNCMLLNKTRVCDLHLGYPLWAAYSQSPAFSWYLDRVSGPSSYNSHGLTWELTIRSQGFLVLGSDFPMDWPAFLNLYKGGYGCQGVGLRLNTTLNLNSTSGKSYKCEQRIERVSHFLGSTLRTLLTWPSLNLEKGEVGPKWKTIEYNLQVFKVNGGIL